MVRWLTWWADSGQWPCGMWCRGDEGDDWPKSSVWVGTLMDVQGGEPSMTGLLEGQKRVPLSRALGFVDHKGL